MKVEEIKGDVNMDYVCKKCGSVNNTFIKQKGNNTGLYCGDCGGWIKWLNKDEINLYEYNNLESENNILRNKDEKDLITRLKEFVSFLDKTIDEEYSKMPLTRDDSIRKNAYCLALERDKNAIINILNGKDFGQ